MSAPLTISPLGTYESVCRNERVICLFDTEFGPIARYDLGATIVGSI
ncbi:phosphatidylserine decarboxylase [Shigella flexneri]